MASRPAVALWETGAVSRADHLAGCGRRGLRAAAAERPVGSNESGRALRTDSVMMTVHSAWNWQGRRGDVEQGRTELSPDLCLLRRVR
jgi:hypothetical protein